MVSPLFLLIFASTVSGTVRGDQDRPIQGVQVQLTHAGETASATTDSEGRFAFHFVAPGRHLFRFEHSSVAQPGLFEVSAGPQDDTTLRVRLHDVRRNPMASGCWEIEEQGGIPANTLQIERVYTDSWIESLPSTGTIWSLLNHTSASVVTERFDISGMHGHRQMLMGVRGSSWTQNQAVFNGINVTHPSGDGMLVFPDLSAVESVTYAVGHSPDAHTGPGAHLIMTPKSGRRQVHGQAHLFFQAGALQDSNANDRQRFFGISESDERWNHYLDGNFQMGGPLGDRPWTYYGSFSRRNLNKDLRNHSLPISNSLNLGSLHLQGRLSPRDQLAIYGSGQRLRRPQSGATPQVRREATLDATQNLLMLQGSWTRFVSPRSLLDLRFGIATDDGEDRFSPAARGQSRATLFPGYALLGSAHPLDLVKLLDDGLSGRALFAGESRNRHWDASAMLSTVRSGFRNSSHRITLGGNFRTLSSDLSRFAQDGLHLLYFQEKPDSVRLLNTPVRTRDRLRQQEIHFSDVLTLGPLSLNLGIYGTFSQGMNLLNSGKKSNSLSMKNLSGRFGMAFQPFKKYPLVLRGRMARIYHQPLVSTWTAVNPAGLGTRLFAWNDANGDDQFQPGEDTRILKVNGAPYSRLDPGLSNPYTTEVGLGWSHRLSRALTYHVNGFRRVGHELMSLVNTGVPFSSYTPVQVVDPGGDGDLAAGGDDGIVTVYNQKPETLGQDRFLLTNPEGHNAFSEGFEIRVEVDLGNFRGEGSASHYRAVAATAPGMEVRQNDTGVLLGVFNDPNSRIFAYGSTYFDRGTLGRVWAAYRFPRDIHWSAIASYQDGLPYSRYLPVAGLNQGVTGILTRQRGPGAAGSKGGFMTTFYLTLDMRVSRSFALGPGKVTAMADVFNLPNLAQSLLQTDVTAPTHLWRIPLSFQTPRSLQLGIRYQW